MSTNRREDLLKSCVKELQCCVEYVQRYSDNPDQQLDVLKNIAKEYCELDIQHGRAQEAREATDRHFDNQENDCTEDVQQIYNKYLEELPAAATYTNHSIWKKITSAAKGIQSNSVEEHSDDDNSVDEVEDDNRSIDEEGIVPSQFEPPIDPITKRPIENPCKNRKCGHVYEYSTIMDHLNKMKQNKTKLRCPYIGCANANMKPSFIVQDNALRRQIQSYVANRSEQLDTSSQSSVIL